MPQMGRGQATNFQSQPRHEAPAFAHESIAAPRRWRSSHDPSIPSTHSRSLCCFSTRIPGNLPRKSQGLRSTQRDNTSSPNQLNMLKIKSRGADRKIATGVAACPGSLGFLIGQWYDAKHTDCQKNCGSASPILCRPCAIWCSFVQFLSPNLRWPHLFLLLLHARTSQQQPNLA
ncbi:hypothetical protein NA56DRAFT_238513 [Hyaloscypha hepaticicola]|uniref:Uncharacterized protein n=1 Tax=Hyaloscypha hepaticicola TaxID=2082293 RepID=A0A2J6QML9_9HELO|nr:hypothetical protein NA56DRAFT_238513 [Hyaloscypha hepaticicola]